VWAVVALAPWDASGVITEGNAAITVPTLVMTGREDATTPLRMVRGLWSPVAAEPRAFAIVDDAGHYSFSPVACLLETGDGCGEGFLSEEAFTPIVQQASTAFLSAALGVQGAGDQVGVDQAGVDWELEGDF
jgi:predicted dienelactone hydrolase